MKQLLQKRTAIYTPGVVYAPLSGTCIPLDQVADPVFAGGMLGKGIGIEPDNGELLAPVDGIVTLIAKTKHALGITTADGAELLLHIGLDTVEMNGDGFQCYVQQNQSVTLGQRLMRFDLDKIRAAGHGTTLLVVVTNSFDLVNVEFDTQNPVRCREPIGHYTAKHEQ
ncbi:MAG: PTS glucose transporter subunit IIA [Christensenella sp.]|nr:PTS glucose transporter subunit IIA [Christensenella sp.]